MYCNATFNRRSLRIDFLHPVGRADTRHDVSRLFSSIENLSHLEKTPRNTFSPFFFPFSHSERRKREFRSTATRTWMRAGERARNTLGWTDDRRVNGFVFSLGRIMPKCVLLALSSSPFALCNSIQWEPRVISIHHRLECIRKDRKDCFSPRDAAGTSRSFLGCRQSPSVSPSGTPFKG